MRSIESFHFRCTYHFLFTSLSSSHVGASRLGNRQALVEKVCVYVIENSPMSDRIDETKMQDKMKSVCALRTPNQVTVPCAEKNNSTERENGRQRQEKRWRELLQNPSNKK